MSFRFFALPASVTFDENAVNAAPRYLLGQNIAVDGATTIGGGVTLTITGLLAEDRLAVVSDLALARTDITALNGTLFWDQRPVGSVTGGVGAPLVITIQNALNTFLYPRFLEEILESITYQNVSDRPTPSRTLSAVVTGGHPVPASFTLGIDVTPENDAPSITSVGAVTLQESENFTYTARATDPERDVITWSLGGADAALFTIAPSTERIRFSERFDFEQPRDADRDNVYQLVLRADDGGTVTTKPLSITVTDVRGFPVQSTVPVFSFGENATNAAPQAIGAGLSLTATGVAGARLTVTGLLPEDRVSIADEGSGSGQIGFNGTTIRFGGAVVGSAVGGMGEPLSITFNTQASLAAADAVLQALTYRNASDTPVASRVLVLDLEGAGGAPLILGPGGAGVSRLEVRVTAEDDAPVVTSPGGVFAVAENTTGPVYQAAASDPDGTAISWSLGGADAARFAITAGGAVAFAETPDFEAPADSDGDNRYEILVTATSGGVATQRAVTIAVTEQREPGLLALNGPAPVLGEGQVNGGPQAFAGGVVFGALDSMAGGRVSVFGLLPEDRVTLLTAGNGPGQIALDGATVRFGGADIGTVAGGAGAPFSVALNGAATAEAVAALIAALGYANASDTPTPLRGLRLEVTDAAGRSFNHTGAPAFAPFAGSPPLPAIDVGTESRPTFADLDGDGREDLVIGTGDGGFQVWRNTGSGFTELTGAANPLDSIDVGTFALPAFADLTGDGRPDLVTGTAAAGFRVFRNDGGEFTELAGAANPLTGLSPFIGLTPSFVDLDGDGRLDLVAGRAGLGLRGWLNTGAGYVPLGADDPLLLASTGFLTTAVFIDLNGDSRLDLVSGNVAGTLAAFLRDDAGYTRLEGAAAPFAGLDLGTASAPALADLDGDGRRDLVIGASDGTLTLLRNVTASGLDLPLRVIPVNDAPEGPATIALPASPEDAPILVTRASLLAGWSDPEGAALQVTGLSILSPGGGTIVQRPDGDFDLTPPAADTTGIVLRYSVSDGAAATQGTATIDLLPVDDLPTGGIGIGILGGTTLVARSTLADADGVGQLSYVWQTLRVEPGGDTSWQDIPEATDAAFVPDATLLGKPLRVMVSYTDGGGTLNERENGASILFGRTTADSLTGGTEDDFIFGGAGRDTLVGGDGDDVLIGGAGPDRLTGGAGADGFRFLTRTEGTDVITDFTPGVDHIEVLRAAFAGLPLGDLAASRFVSGPVATAARAQFVYDQATGTLRFDADGTGARAPFVLATLVGAPVLQASDIQVIA